MKPKQFELLLLLSLVTALLMSACASPMKSAKPQPAPQTATPVISVCLAWKPVLFSRLHDTPETIEQAKANNAARDAYCGS